MDNPYGELPDGAELPDGTELPNGTAQDLDPVAGATDGTLTQQPELLMDKVQMDDGVEPKPPRSYRRGATQQQELLMDIKDPPSKQDANPPPQRLQKRNADPC